MIDLALHKQLEIINTRVMKGELDPGQAADRQEAFIAEAYKKGYIDGSIKQLNKEHSEV